MLEDEKDYSLFLAGDNTGFERLVIRYKDGLIYYLNKIIKNIMTSLVLVMSLFGLTACGKDDKGKTKTQEEIFEIYRAHFKIK